MKTRFTNLRLPAQGDETLDGELLISDDQIEAATEQSAAEAANERELYCSFQPWYGSSELAHLPRLSRHPAAPTFEVLELSEEGRLAVFHGAYLNRRGMRT